MSKYFRESLGIRDNESRLYVFLLFLEENIRCGCTLIAPHTDASHENLQHMFSLGNKYNVSFRASKSWLDQ